MKTFAIEPEDCFFDVEIVPLLAQTRTKEGILLPLAVPRRLAIVATKSRTVVGVVGKDYHLFTNREAMELAERFAIEAFPDTAPSDWMFRAAHAPADRAWAAMDLFHRSCAVHFEVGLPSEDFTPYLRVTNSYDASRAVRLDVGFMRGICSNGMIFAEAAARVVAPHTPEGIRRLRDGTTSPSPGWKRSSGTSAVP
jgi:hypothetical protein